MKIGIVPAGYYEGVDRRLSNRGYMFYGKHKCKILGTVCMNLSIIDLSGVKGAKKGHHVDFINGNIREIADLCKTITYVIWTHIAPTIRRIVKTS
jgi:alanine racemase